MTAEDEATAASEIDRLWDARPAWITSFWGWSPETWGTVSFTNEARRDTVAAQSPDPFIVVIYVTKGTREDDSNLGGMVVGYYVVSHVKGHRNDFTDPWHYTREPTRWQYGLKALRAFSFLPEYRLPIDVLDPTMVSRARSVAAFAAPLTEDQIEQLRRVPYVEVPVYGGGGAEIGDIVVPPAKGKMVRAGPVNRSGHWVPGEPIDTPKELYALRLNGELSAYLKTPVAAREVYKIGLSMSPATRLEAFQKAMPEGKFEWELLRSTRKDREPPYPRFEAAEVGERAMKKALASAGEWLGGEFYAATPASFEAAWQAGRAAALAYKHGAVA